MYGKYGFLLKDKDKTYNQKLLSDFYDLQIMKKKFKDEYERYIDHAQAEIWKKDSNDYLEREMKIEKMIKDCEKENAKVLDKQIKMGKNDIDKMTPFERKYNHDLLQRAIEYHQKNCLY